MKGRERIDGQGARAGWTPGAIVAVAIVAMALCAECLYTIAPAMAGPSTTYPQSADSQPSAAPSPASQPSSQSTLSTAQGAAHP